MVSPGVYPWYIGGYARGIPGDVLAAYRGDIPVVCQGVYPWYNGRYPRDLPEIYFGFMEHPWYTWGTPVIYRNAHVV